MPTETEEVTLARIRDWLDRFAPPELAEDWDNTGLLAGDPQQSIARIMTCLTITPESAREAIENKAGLIVTHHPLPFRPLKRLTTDQTPTRLLWELISNRIAIYSPHTSFDSASRGINQMLAERLKLDSIEPLVPDPDHPGNLGSGRCGELPSGSKLRNLLDRVSVAVHPKGMRYVGTPDQPVTRVACACGAGGTFLEAAIAAGCDALVTGEANFHDCLEARATGVGLVLTGHYYSERFALEELAAALKDEFQLEEIWASQQESDPLSVV